MEKLKSIVEEAVAELEGVLSADQTDRVARVIEEATIRGFLEGQHRAVDTCKNMSEQEMDLAHQIAAAIRKKNDVLIANLSSLR